MACSRNRTYYVVSRNTKMMYGYNKIGSLAVIENLPWLKPYLFSSVKKAREIADKLGYSVRYWPGRATVNLTSDNQ